MTYRLTQEEAAGILYSWLYEYGLPGVNMNEPGNSPAEIVDRWLAETIRQAKETAWEEGHEDGQWNLEQTHMIDWGIKQPITNPYRSQP